METYWKWIGDLKTRPMISVVEKVAESQFDFIRLAELLIYIFLNA